MVNTERLNKELVKLGMRKDKLAIELKISRQSLSNKINNRTAFKSSEVMFIKDLLGLDPDNCMEIFFARPGDFKSPKEA